MLPDQLIGVKGWVPRFEVNVAEDDASDVQVWVFTWGVDGDAIGGLWSGGGHYGGIC